jgi:hypothetical protein
MVHACRRDGVNRLPTVKELSARFHAGTRAILTELHRLADAGVLSLHPRRGIHLRSNAALPPFVAPVTPIRNKGEWLRAHVSERITGGQYPAGQPLPSLRRLSIETGANYRTLRGALYALVTDGLLEPYRKTFRVPQASARSGSGEVLLLFAGGRLGDVVRSTPWSEAFFANLQHELSMHSLQLRMANAEDMLAGPAASRMRVSSRTLGCIVHALFFAHSQLESTMARLRRHRLPTALYHDGHPELLQTFRSACAGLERNLIVAVGSTTLDGERVGRYLQLKGHRRAALFTLARSEARAIPRVVGLQRALGDDGLVLYGPDDEPESGADYLRRRPYAEWLSRHDEWRARAGADREPVSYYSSGRDAHSQVLTSVAATALERTFARAIRDPSLTAWVGIDDRAALCAATFLRNQRIVPAAARAVIGFDNSIESLAADCSSYDFNIRAAVTMLVDFVIAPSRRRALALDDGVWSAPGFVVERATTATTATDRARP